MADFISGFGDFLANAQQNGIIPPQTPVTPPTDQQVMDNLFIDQGLTFRNEEDIRTWLLQQPGMAHLAKTAPDRFNQALENYVTQFTNLGNIQKEEAAGNIERAEIEAEGQDTMRDLFGTLAARGLGASLMGGGAGSGAVSDLNRAIQGGLASQLRSQQDRINQMKMYGLESRNQYRQMQNEQNARNSGLRVAGLGIRAMGMATANPYLANGLGF